jgi:hypothetical protein
MPTYRNDGKSILLVIEGAYTALKFQPSAAFNYTIYFTGWN